MMKKFIAMAAALACAMTVASPAFAAVTGQATASHDNGIVKLSSTADISADKQWTVVIIPKALQNETLAADDLLYINQGTSADEFWMAKGMGTKGGKLADGEYIIRIGGQAISTAADLIEIELKVGSEGRELQLGDVDFADGIGTPDVNMILDYMLGTIALEGDALAVADVDQADGVGTPDVNMILDYMLGTILELGTITVK